MSLLFYSGAVHFFRVHGMHNLANYAMSKVFLFFVMTISAIFLSFSLQEAVLDESHGYAQRVWLYETYGALWNSIGSGTACFIS